MIVARLARTPQVSEIDRCLPPDLPHHTASRRMRLPCGYTVSFNLKRLMRGSVSLFITTTHAYIQCLTLLQHTPLRLRHLYHIPPPPPPRFNSSNRRPHARIRRIHLSPRHRRRLPPPPPRPTPTRPHCIRSRRAAMQPRRNDEAVSSMWHQMPSHA